MGKSCSNDDKKTRSGCRRFRWIFVRHRRIGWAMSTEYRFVFCVIFDFKHTSCQPGLLNDFFFPVERYDPRQNKWTSMAPMSTRRKHLGCAVFNNMIYAVGGRDDCMELSSAERYNPHTNSWSPIVAMTSRRSGVSYCIGVKHDPQFCIMNNTRYIFEQTLQKRAKEKMIEIRRCFSKPIENRKKIQSKFVI